MLMACNALQLRTPYKYKTTLATHQRSKPSKPMANSIRIAIVGDVHDDWDNQEDAKALHYLKPDLVLFTGDFGNENVELVKGISGLDLPKAVILGNHDAWNTGTFSSKGMDSVQAQLASLGKEHIGYARLDFPKLKLSIVGGRPFSSGGNKIFRPRIIAARYGVETMEESASKIFETTVGAPDGHSIVLLAHNGPRGLGSNKNDICGKDWGFKGGDHGDPDLAEAMLLLKNNSKLKTPLVVFGHMHKKLAYSDIPRTMLKIGDDGIIYLNGAIVPRVQYFTPESEDGTTGFPGRELSCNDRTCGATKRGFTVVDLVDEKPTRITEAWVTVNEEVTRIEEALIFECSSVQAAYRDKCI